MALNLGELVAHLTLDSKGFDQGMDHTEKRGSAWVKNCAKYGALAAVGIGAAAKGLYEIGSTFDDVSDTIRTKTGATGKELEALEGVAKKVGSSIPVSFQDSSDMVADLNKRLGLTGKPLEDLSKKFLEAGRLSEEAIDVDTFTGAFQSFGVEGEEASKVMDKMWQISQDTGVGMNGLAASVLKNAPALKGFGYSIEESASLVGTLDKAGLGSDKTIGSLNKAMVTFAKDGKKPKEALAETVSGMEDLIKKGDDAGALNMASKIFGTKGAGQFVAALKSGKVNLDDLTKGTSGSSDTIMKASKDTADFAEKWMVFKNKALLALEPVATRVFNTLGDGMTYVTENIVPLISTFVKGMQTGEGAGGSFAAKVETIGNVVGTAAGVVGKMVAFVIKYRAVLIPLVTVLATFALTYKTITGAMNLWKTATTAMRGAQIALNVAMTANPIGLVIALVAALAVGFYLLWKKSDTFRALVKGLWASMKSFGSWIKGVFTGALAGAGDAFGKVKDKASAAFGWVKRNWPLLLAIITGPIGLAVYAVAKNWDKIKDGAQTAKDAVTRKFNALVTFFTKMPGRLSEAAKGMWSGMTGGLKSVINRIIDMWNSIDFSIDIKVPGWVPGIGGKGWASGDIFGDIPQLANGGLVPATAGGVVANLAEAGEDEIVSPVSLMKKIVGDALAGSQRGNVAHNYYMQEQLTGNRIDNNRTAKALAARTHGGL